MKTMLKALSVAVLSASLAYAGDTAKDVKDLKKIVEDQGIYVETAQHGIVLSGYVDTSYTYQFPGKVVTPKDSAAGLAGAGSTLRENGNTTPLPSSEAVGRQFDTDA